MQRVKKLLFIFPQIFIHIHDLVFTILSHKPYLMQYYTPLGMIIMYKLLKFDFNTSAFNSNTTALTA